MMYISAVVAVAQIFTIRRTLAVGIALCGASAGLIVLCPVVSWVVDLQGWRVSLQVLCAASLGCGGLVWGAWTETAQNTETGSQEEEPEEKNVSVSRIASHEYLTVFLVIVLGDSLAMISLYTLYSHLTSLGEHGHLLSLAQHGHLPSLTEHGHLASLAQHGHLPVSTIIGLGSA